MKTLATAALAFTTLAQAGTLVINTEPSEPEPRAACRAGRDGPELQASQPQRHGEAQHLRPRRFQDPHPQLPQRRGPDIVSGYTGNRIAPFVKAAHFEDVSNLQSKEGLAVKLQSAHAAMTLDGQPWGVP